MFIYFQYSLYRLDPISDRSDEGGASSSASGWGDVHSPASLSRKTSPAKPKFGNDIGMHNTAIPSEIIQEKKEKQFIIKLEQILKLLSNQCKSSTNIGKLMQNCSINLPICERIMHYYMVIFIYIFIHSVTT